jgi:hypothetical protein
LDRKALPQEGSFPRNVVNANSLAFAFMEIDFARCAIFVAAPRPPIFSAPLRFVHSRNLRAGGHRRQKKMSVRRRAERRKSANVPIRRLMMGEFTFLYRGGNANLASPEERQKQMEKWMTWFKELGAKGHVKDPGHPLERSGKIVGGKPIAVSDGPFAEAKDVIGGYTLIEAKDLAEAAEVAKGCPILGVGGAVEVRPVMKM